MNVTPKKTIVFAVYSLSQWPLVRSSVKRLKEIGVPCAVVSFNHNSIVNNQLEKHAESLGVQLLLQAAVTEARMAAGDTIEPETEQPGRAGWTPDEAELQYRRLLATDVDVATKMLDETNAGCLIVLEDGPGGNGALIHAANLKNIPVLVTPFGVGESTDYDIFIEDRQRQGGVNRVPEGEVGALIRKWASHWIRDTIYGEILLHPAEFILAKVATGLDLRHPWVVQGGYANCIAVESAAMRQIYKKEGLSGDKLKDCGSVYCDAVYEAINEEDKYRTAYIEGTKIKEGLTKLLIALPPSYHEVRGDYNEFDNYKEMVGSILEQAADIENIEVTVSIHPNAHEDEVNAIRDTGVNVSRQWLVRELGRYDIFLTTWSSTIRWAITARKPVLNYDAYGTELPTYGQAPGVVTSRSIGDLMEHLGKLCSDDGAYKDHVARQRSVAHEWGILDGKNFNRIHALIEQLMANP